MAVNSARQRSNLFCRASSRPNCLRCKDLRVEDRGLEPLTSCMPCKRSPS